jgi:hypothetical protein
VHGTGGGDLELASLPLGLVERRDGEKVSLGAASKGAKDVGTYTCVFLVVLFLVVLSCGDACD